MSTYEKPHVAVIGAGPVGLAAGLLLSRFGIRATILEKETRMSGHPKARGVRPRTMELFARWGLADAIIRQGLPPEANRFIYCDSLVGEEVGRSPASEESDDPVSPMGICRIAQDTIERMLRDHVENLDGVDLLLGAEAVAIEQDPESVTVTTADGREITADFLIAADGAHSATRSRLGIDMEGDALLGYGQSIYWRGDLSQWVEGRLCIQFITGNRTGRPASIAPVDGVDRWVTMLMRPGAHARPEPPTRREALDAIRAAVGADIDPEIIDIATWRLSAQVARRWRVGRVFLAGDAAHSFPPTGGFGMNTGVQDVDNLIWKMAEVLGGRAGDSLLDTYEQERADIARSNAAWSVRNGDRIRDIGRAIAAGDGAELERLLEEQRSHVDAADQDLGYGYPAGALAGEDGPDVDALRVARRGHRFPEAPVIVDDELHSSVLTLSDEFTLMTADPQFWQRSGRTDSLRVLESAGGLPDGSPGALVRPDGIVAWVARPGDGPAELVAARAQVLRP
ncbi:FAD-dependent monooxygenase [Microbacterium soli]|uniref:FAD-dependent monooxygenase n=1 Tax=Microbacterium soli TaxID=446075 RepID=A0ABP7N667_9MICO